MSPTYIGRSAKQPCPVSHQPSTSTTFKYIWKRPQNHEHIANYTPLKIQNGTGILMILISSAMRKPIY